MLEPGAHRRAVGGADRVDVADVVGAERAGGAGEVRMEPGVVGVGDAPARGVPAVEVRELDAEDRALHAVHAVVEAVADVVVLAGLAPVAERAHGLGVRGVVGGDAAALAGGAEVLAGVEAEGGDVAPGAGAAAVARRAVRLAGVLDDDEAVGRAMALIAAMSARRPCRWTGRIALVRGVIAASISAGSIVQVAASTSTKTGVAPA